jgi:hypothetical protein
LSHFKLLGAVSAVQCLSFRTRRNFVREMIKHKGKMTNDGVKNDKCVDLVNYLKCDFWLWILIVNFDFPNRSCNWEGRGYI